MTLSQVEQLEFAAMDALVQKFLECADRLYPDGQTVEVLNIPPTKVTYEDGGMRVRHNGATTGPERSILLDILTLQEWRDTLFSVLDSRTQDLKQRVTVAEDILKRMGKETA